MTGSLPALGLPQRTAQRAPQRPSHERPSGRRAARAQLRRPRLLVVVAVLALLATACGSNGASTVDTAAPADSGDASADSGDAQRAAEEAAAEPAGSNDRPAEGLTATLGRGNWSSGYVQAQILHDLLEELGYEVTSPDQFEFAPDLAYQTMARGEIDFWANSWYPSHLSWWEGELPDGTAIGDNLVRLEGSLMPGGGLQGYLVTKAWVDEAGFTTMDEINDTEALWQALDSDGNGKGEFYGCPEDWTCDDIMASTIEFAGWDNLEQVQAGYDAMFADFLVKAQAGEPAITYTWAPTSYLAQAIPGDTTMWLSTLDASVLDSSNPLGKEGGDSYDQLGGYKGLGPETCTQGPDGCQTGWIAADIEITANTEWMAANPIAGALFDVFKPPLIDLAIAGVDLESSDGTQADVEKVAAGWIADNRALADEWLAVARAAA